MRFVCRMCEGEYALEVNAIRVRMCSPNICHVFMRRVTFERVVDSLYI